MEKHLKFQDLKISKNNIDLVFTNFPDKEYQVRIYLTKEEYDRIANSLR